MASTARNVRVDDELWELAKLAAGATGTTASAVMVDALRELVDQARAAGLVDTPRGAGEQPLF